MAGLWQSEPWQVGCKAGGMPMARRSRQCDFIACGLNLEDQLRASVQGVFSARLFFIQRMNAASSGFAFAASMLASATRRYRSSFGKYSVKSVHDAANDLRAALPPSVPSTRMWK